MRTLKISLLVLILSISVSAQVFDTLWTKTFGSNEYESGTSIQQTLDGGFIVAGIIESSGFGDFDAWIIKTNGDGDTIWTKTFGGNLADYCFSILQTRDSGYVITGMTTSLGDGSGDVWLLKTNPSGVLLWNKIFGGSSSDNGYSVQQTSDEGYIVCGSTYSFGAGRYDVWLIKTNSFGDTLWTRTFGGIENDEAFSVQELTSGGYILAGYTESFGVGSMNGWLIKTDSSGVLLWEQTYTGLVGVGNLFSIQQTNDEGYILAGGTLSTVTPTNDVWLIKTDSLGDTIWTKTFGGSDGDEATCVQETKDGGYIVSANTFSFGAGESDIWLIKTNSFGDTIWTKTIGGTDQDGASLIQETSDGGFIIIGGTNSFGAGNGDIWMIKTTSGINDINQTSDIIFSKFILKQNYPNPFNPVTKIKFTIPFVETHSDASLPLVTLRVYDLLGREVATLVNEKKPAGEYEVEFDGNRLPSGIYFYQLKAGEFSETKKMILLK